MGKEKMVRWPSPSEWDWGASARDHASANGRDEFDR